MSAETVIYEEEVPGGSMWSGIVRRHTTLRLTDIAGGANVGLMAYAAAQPLDRLNLPDSLKAQYTAKLTRGHVLMSDMGHALLSITADTVGWHDPLGGHTRAAEIAQQYGAESYQQARNAWRRSAHELFLIELGKHGLGARDLVANVNFFSRLDVAVNGAVSFYPGNSRAGDTVDLRAEMDVLVVLNTVPHPLDRATTWAPKPVVLTFLRTPPPPADDFCRTFRAENARSFELTERLYR